MKPPETNDPLEALLLEHDGYIEDGGFTARVVAALPSRRRSWLRPAILLGATLIGFALLALFLLPLLRDFVVAEPGGGFSISAQSLVTLAIVLVAAASLFWSVFAVVKWED